MSKIFAAIKGIGKLVMAVAPAVNSIGQAIKERRDPRNYATRESIKEHAREEKHEAKCLRIADEITDTLASAIDSGALKIDENKRLDALIDKYRAHRAKT